MKANTSSRAAASSWIWLESMISAALERDLGKGSCPSSGSAVSGSTVQPPMNSASSKESKKVSFTGVFFINNLVTRNVQRNLGASIMP